MTHFIIASSLLGDFKLPVDVSVETFVLTLAIMLLVVFGMAIGVIFRGKELKGSCGGKGGDECFCEKNNLPRACEQIGSHLGSQKG
ncbi:MAG: hypothetical protein VYE40_19960 [Myxococcota bacterium]|jgi:hypothetical protein|nr:hypothetical protein [Myxococcota bacterium]